MYVVPLGLKPMLYIQYVYTHSSFHYYKHRNCVVYGPSTILLLKQSQVLLKTNALFTPF